MTTDDQEPQSGDPLLDSVRKAVPEAFSIEDAKLGLPDLKAYWVTLTSRGSSDRGLGVVSRDGKVFVKREDGMRQVLATGTKDPMVLARAAMVLLEHGGVPLASAADLPAKAQGEAKGASIAAPSLAGNTLTYWSYYRKTTKPGLVRSEVDLTTLAVTQRSPGDDVDPIDRALAGVDSASETMRRSAVETLGKACPDPRAVAGLVKTVRTNAHADARGWAAGQLGTCRDPSGITALIDVLGSDTDKEVRAWAAGSLGSLGDARARPALEKAARDDKDEGVRRVAAKSLKQLP